MIKFETEGLNGNRKFWIFTVAFMAPSGLFQIFIGEHLLGITFIGTSITFAAVAYEQLKEDEA